MYDDDHSRCWMLSTRRGNLYYKKKNSRITSIVAKSHNTNYLISLLIDLFFYIHLKILNAEDTQFVPKTKSS